MSEFKKLYNEYSFNKIEEKYKLYFEDKELLVRSFVHSSLFSEINQNYQRLEFLGDSVLQVVVSDYIYRNFPEKREGEMSKTRSKLVSEPSLAQLVKSENLDQYLLIGKSLSNDYKESDSYISDIFESFVAAIYLDRGYNAAEKFIYDTVIAKWDTLINLEMSQDYKTKFQELVQQNGTVQIKYFSEKIDNLFEATVEVNDLRVGVGIGNSKKKAEQNAAKNALEKYNNWEENYAHKRVEITWF